MRFSVVTIFCGNSVFPFEIYGSHNERY